MPRAGGWGKGVGEGRKQVRAGPQGDKMASGGVWPREYIIFNFNVFSVLRLSTALPIKWRKNVLCMSYARATLGNSRKRS